MEVASMLQFRDFKGNAEEPTEAKQQQSRVL